jgi:hypothetical protein
VNTRAKLFGTGFLLCIAVGVTIFCAIQTVQAIQTFQKNHNLALSGDVSTIRSWMTIPYIARAYHVPESYLYDSLHISKTLTMRRDSLHTLALRYNRPIDAFISEVQHVILAYRKQHPSSTMPILALHDKGPPISRRKAG